MLDAESKTRNSEGPFFLRAYLFVNASKTLFLFRSPSLSLFFFFYKASNMHAILSPEQTKKACPRGIVRAFAPRVTTARREASARSKTRVRRGGSALHAASRTTCVLRCVRLHEKRALEILLRGTIVNRISYGRHKKNLFISIFLMT